ncbi:site-specific integrase [Microtetraspora sp. NBRC 16547]|uniref:tyrosine-type recombinase/integrase n=1 Tax=Microtetraspora sp. NBRC 16547 TaxID=3030993 RepID=UPI0024A4704A|nr:site-specific integrase [Microtetraspora sp. NBRC 16547]GLX00996.1 site-specific integrase [Microtetraspora sp. NBRC 16547]
MTTRRSRGDGGLHWDEQRERWVATVTVGYTPAGKRIVKKASGKTKTEAKAKLKEIIRDYEDGLAIASGGYTVADAVKYWLEHGLKGRGSKTVGLYTEFAENHVISALGARKLRDLSVEDVDRWLASKAPELSTRTLKMIHGILNRSVKNAMVRDKVKRNVVDLCEVPEGREGRKSKALTLAQATAVMAATEQANARMRGYVVLSLLTGARTEELRELSWTHVVAFDQERKMWLPVTVAGWEHTEYAVYVWRSVRQSGDTKTVKSRRTLKLPQLCVEALRKLWEHEGLSDGAAHQSATDRLVFCTKNGTALSAGNVRRDFRKILKDAGLVDAEWTPREMRHSFVSLLSDSGVPIEHISRLVGHANTVVTETVYRLQIRPVMQEGATAMDGLFGNRQEA